MENIQLETTTSFKLTHNKLHSMYVRIALCQFAQLRNPQYKENVLLKKLIADFKNMNYQMSEIAAHNPNNHTVRKMASFFDNHYKNLLSICDTDIFAR